jgi:hypothetical protein
MFLKMIIVAHDIAVFEAIAFTFHLIVIAIHKHTEPRVTSLNEIIIADKRVASMRSCSSPVYFCCSSC